MSLSEGAGGSRSWDGTGHGCLEMKEWWRLSESVEQPVTLRLEYIGDTEDHCIIVRSCAKAQCGSLLSFSSLFTLQNQILHNETIFVFAIEYTK